MKPGKLALQVQASMHALLEAAEREGAADPTASLHRELNVLSNQTDRAILLELIKNHATTAPTLMHKLDLHRSTTYDSIKRLKIKGLVASMTTIEKHRHPGPKAEVIGLTGNCTPEDVQKAIKEHIKYNSKVFRLATDTAENIYNELKQRGGPLETTQIAIYKIIKQMKLQYSLNETANFIIKELASKGVKIWTR